MITNLIPILAAAATMFSTLLAPAQDTGHPPLRPEAAKAIEEARKKVDAIEKSDEAQPEEFIKALSKLGIAYSEGARFDEAVATLQKAIELAPNEAIVYVNLGTVLQMQEKFDEAFVSYRKAIKLDPDLAIAYFNLGVGLRNQGKSAAAIAPLKTAIELDPSDAMAHSNLGVALQMQDKFGEALASLRKAIELNPDLAAAHLNLGTALLLHGKLIEAEKSFREALKLSPNPQLQARLESLLTLDRKLLGILQKEGANHPSVKVLVQQFSKVIPFGAAPQDLVRKTWENSPELVLRELEQRTLTVMMVRKGAQAQRIAEGIHSKLREGVVPEIVAGELGSEVIFRKRNEQKREDFPPELQDMAFKTPVGEVSEIVDARDHLFVAKVDSSTPGKAGDFDAPGVKEAAENAFKKQRRKKWEKSYLERLQKRIKEGGE